MLVGQIDPRFKDAKLLEVAERSYIIQNHVKMPVWGNKVMFS